MEKLIYALAGDAPFRDGRGRRRAADLLAASGARGVTFNVADQGPPTNGAPEVGYRAVVQLWLDSGRDAGRLAVEEALGALGVPPVAGWVVTESVPLPDHRHPPGSGRRTPGFAQLAFLRRPDALDRAAWLDRWLNHHTEVAVATQSTFGYLQNVVARPLAGDDGYEGIVEELFPAAARTDLSAFFDAVGDEERFGRNAGAMWESVSSFLPGGSAEVVWTSRYVMLSPFVP